MGSPATVNLTGNSGSIQWQSSADNITFNNINGASSSSYTAPSLAVTTWYRAVVTSGVCVSANSTTATVSVSPLSIAGSANATTPEICSGSSATLSLTGNSGNIQWQSSTDNITFNNITGATAPGYNISVLTSTAYYRAMVTSGVCAATVTDTVVITVDNASAGGTVNAAQDTLCPGNATVLALSGNVGLIQWQSSADNLVYNNIPGATSGTYTTPVLVSTTYYRVASTNDVCPSAYSASNALMVLPATVIQAGPISQVACQGSQVVFNVSASGANLVYQWYKKGNNITGSTAPSYAIDSVSAVDSAVYYVSVAGTCGTAISDTVSLALTGTLQISQQPVSQSLCLGNQVVFSVTVNGVNVHYQWMQNNDTIVNALSSTYSVPAINVSDSGTYVCRISSTCGDISSNLAALSILQPSFNSYNQNWCSGTPYVFNGRNLTTSGTYSDTLQAANSCDSIVTITLTLIPVRHDSVYQTICSGQSYSFNGNHLTTSGSYNDTLPGANGCDSIVTLILTALRVYNTTVSQTICFGQSFVFNQHGCQATGTYPDTLISINNCDSIVTLYLTVLPFSGSTISDTVCADRVYNFNGRFILTAGMYYDTLPNANGCDSLVTLNLVVLPTVVTSLQRTVCAGNTYNFNGQLLATGGVYSDTLQAVNGCDSIVNLTLGILPTSSVTLNVNVCQGSACFFNGHYISTAGTYRDTLPGANGCDSITILNLATPSVIFTTLSDTICSGNNYLFNGTVLTGGGTYTDTLMALGGCDSIVILTLGLRQTSVVALADTICAGSSYSFNGRLLSVGGVYSDTLTNINGCDSFVTLNLIVLPVDTSVLTEGICFGGGYMFNGHLLSTAGTYYDTITGGLYGCDSIVVLHLTVEPVITDSVSGFICHGGNYPFNGRLLTTAGIYADTLHIAAGCDSVVVLILIERPASVTALTDSICMGSSYNFNGRVLSLPGSYNDTIPAGNTCDSVISLNLIVKSMNDSATVSGPICIALENGAIYQWMDCNTNNHITGATSQTYTALRNGNYKCVITIGNCSDTSNCVNVTTIAIKAITDYSFNLYPNPNSGIFTIEHNYKGNLKVQIVSIIGDEVKTFSLVRPIEQFDINELAAGVYEVFISDDKQLLKVLKIVKQ
jgi:hypothetical protein